ncbi:hypothetical protein NDU88_004874 [Pleurodeles waltl]|uniref:Uncharacterized protein n=1 Tax=Pleurodeles waltl TaxID=8319 RepID=A0AAV7WTN4_PLEWA|nr:hypothetical protein NDU88_004874 [Pleurodeles waltl]
MPDAEAWNKLGTQCLSLWTTATTRGQGRQGVKEKEKTRAEWSGAEWQAEAGRDLKRLSWRSPPTACSPLATLPHPMRYSM